MQPKDIHITSVKQVTALSNKLRLLTTQTIVNYEIYFVAPTGTSVFDMYSSLNQKLTTAISSGVFETQLKYIAAINGATALTTVSAKSIPTIESTSILTVIPTIAPISSTTTNSGQISSGMIGGIVTGVIVLIIATLTYYYYYCYKKSLVKMSLGDQNNFGTAVY